MKPQQLSKRYRSGYNVSRMINGIGAFCQALGLILACILGAGGAYAAQYINQYTPPVVWVAQNLHLPIQYQLGIVIGVAAFAALITFLVLWLIGTVISAIAQVLKAILDTAVNTSPFLSTEEKAGIIP